MSLEIDGCPCPHHVSHFAEDISLICGKWHGLGLLFSTVHVAPILLADGPLVCIYDL